MLLTIYGDQEKVDRFQWIWGQYITGFDGLRHCLPCLKGVREKQITKKMSEREVQLRNDFDYFYLFAMGAGDRALTNVHLPVRPFPGAVASVGSAYGVRFTIRDAVQVRVRSIPDGWRNLPPRMTRCRNFQFGVHVFPTAEIAMGPLAEEVVSKLEAEAAHS